MNNVIRLRPLASNYASMSPQQLLEAFTAWTEEPGSEEVYTRDWLNRGFELLPAVNAVAVTSEMRALTQDWYKMCLKIEQAQDGFDAS